MDLLLQYYLISFFECNLNNMGLIGFEIKTRYSITLSLVAENCNDTYQHKCYIGGNCVDQSKLCDGFKDCSDWSDETSDLCGGGNSFNNVTDSFV